jgi:hypothetical protein
MQLALHRHDTELELPAPRRRLSKVCYVGEEPRAVRPVDMPRLAT